MSEQAPAAAPRARLVAHAVLAGIGLVALAISLRLGLWRQSSPGEGLFPFLTALAMVAFSVAGLVRDWMRRAAAPARTVRDRTGLIRVGAYLGALVFYAVSLEFLGFIQASSVVTCLDGYAMARQSRAGAALGIAAFGSFIAGVLVTAALFVVGPALADFALAFGPAEYTALVLLGLLLVTQLSSGSQIDALLMVAFGLLLSTVGKDPIYGTERFTFHIFSLFDGLNIALLAMGVFGVAELLIMAEGGSAAVQPVVQPKRLLELLPNRADWRASALPILRGTGLGFFLGLLPGGGATLSSFSSYVLERRLAKAPERFGHGAIEGVAGPESANNAAAQSAFVPLLSLGIPANAVMGVILGALLIQGITPGPTLVANRPDIFFGVIASMLIGNLMLIVLNVPLISLFVQILRLPGSILAPLIIVFCVIGAYTLSNNVVEVIIMIGFGIAGYLMRKVDLDPAPLVLAFVLGNILETNFRQALLVGKGTLALFYTRPIAAVLIACSVALIALQVGRAVMRRR